MNVTPDSFSDGGRYATPAAAIARAALMVEEGAAILDVGGESTKPGALPVAEQVELERVLPVIAALAARFDVAISVDTSKPAVMREAVSAGACIINDVFALRAPGALRCAMESQAGVCLMHMRGEPRTMQIDPQYNDVVGEVAAFLLERRAACVAQGLAQERIALDPGVGFGKGLKHNLALLNALAEFAALGSPLLVGVSRKSFIGRLLGREPPDRLYGGLGLAAWAVTQGARIIRTHDVRATCDAVGMVSAVMTGRSSFE